MKHIQETTLKFTDLFVAAIGTNGVRLYRPSI